MAYTKSYRSAPYRVGQATPYRLSRSKIELFRQCPRCFWLGERLKISRPSSPPFNINKTIDELYKKEFDKHRAAKTPHPIMTDNQIKAVPYQHQDLDKWRHNFTGVVAIDEPSNLEVFGAVDDIWVGDDGQLIVVDYKATSKNREVSIDSAWQISYKRQVEIYQWLLRRNGFEVSDTAYFVYTNASMDASEFADILKFKTKLIPYSGDASWVSQTLLDMKACLEGEMPPVGLAAMGGPCEHCAYARARTELTLSELKRRGGQ